MKIGDEVYVHGYVDEIRSSDVVIIRNEGGYFGTAPNEVLEWFSEVCDGCCGAHSNYEPKIEPQTDCAWAKGE